ncbi:hypothetical protein V8C86DRAFT_2530631 [Haematococcus lacustris]
MQPALPSESELSAGQQAAEAGQGEGDSVAVSLLTVLPQPPTTFQSVLFLFFQGSMGQNTWRIHWWFCAPAQLAAAAASPATSTQADAAGVPVRGPYSSESMILAFVKEQLPQDVLVAGTLCQGSGAWPEPASGSQAAPRPSSSRASRGSAGAAAHQLPAAARQLPAAAGHRLPACVLRPLLQLLVEAGSEASPLAAAQQQPGTASVLGYVPWAAQDIRQAIAAERQAAGSASGR